MSTTAISRRDHATLSLAHRWFAFLESSAGNVEEHLGLFVKNVQLTGRRGQVRFAHGHNELAQWFRAVPDEISSHRILHCTWKEGTGAEGNLDFIVAYQTPTADGGVGGSVISYQTVVSFADDVPRFVALDKTPILPNTRHEYSPTWAEHRVYGFVHAVLGKQLTHQEAADAFRDISLAGSRVKVWAPVPEGSTAYDAFLTIGTADGSLHTAGWRFHDDGDAAFPFPQQIAPLRRLTVRDEHPLDAKGTR
jgi:hypothetical protein